VVAQHVRVRLELQAGGGQGPFDHARVRTGVALKPPQRPQLLALDRVGARGAVLDPPDVHHGTGEVDLVPTQVADLDACEMLPVLADGTRMRRL
jgi:hypothetical protein